MKKTAYTEETYNGTVMLMVRGVCVTSTSDHEFTEGAAARLEKMAERINAAEDKYFPDPVKEVLPVDRTQTTLVDGSPVTEDHKELKPNGQQKEYVVLSEAERAKGFVRPVRNLYLHKKCGAVTTMGSALSETYARDPKFYSGTFCCNCGAHFPVAEFNWYGTNDEVGS